MHRSSEPYTSQIKRGCRPHAGWNSARLWFSSNLAEICDWRRGGGDLRCRQGLMVPTMGKVGSNVAVLLLLHLGLIEAFHPPLTLHGMPDDGNPSQMSPSAIKFFGPAVDQPHKFSHQNRHSRHADSPVAGSGGVAAPEPAEPMAHLQHLSARAKDIGEGAMAVIIFCVVLGIVAAVGGSYLYVTRRSNTTRANSFRPIV